jgi:Protein of unknown function (DUF3150)
MSDRKAKLSVLRDVVIISLAEISIWTGRAKLTAEDLGLDPEDLPPDAVASLGSKRLLGAADLKPMTQIRYKMRRICLELGTRFLSGVAVAIDEAPALVKKLDALVEQGEMHKKAFLATLDSKFDDWHAANPKWSHIMRAGTPERERISGKISFGYTPIMIQCPDNDDVAKHLIGSVSTMGHNLVSEVVKEASLFVRQSLTSGREKGSQKTIEPIRRLGKKIESLKFIDPAIGNVAKVVNTILGTIPTVGQVGGTDFLNLTRVAHLLADRGRFENLANSLFDGITTVDEVIKQITGDEVLVEKSQLPLPAMLEGLDISHIFADSTAPRIEAAEADVMEAVAALRTTSSVVVAPVQEVKPVALKSVVMDF